MSPNRRRCRGFRPPSRPCRTYVSPKRPGAFPRPRRTSFQRHSVKSTRSLGLAGPSKRDEIGGNASMAPTSRAGRTAGANRRRGPSADAWRTEPLCIRAGSAIRPPVGGRRPRIKHSGPPHAALGAIDGEPLPNGSANFSASANATIGLPRCNGTVVDDRLCH